MHYKAIILVLASDDDCLANTHWATTRILPDWKPMFPYFKQVWESYHTYNPNLKVLYVYGNSKITPQPYDLVYKHVEENNYPGMITKTLLAMQDIEKNFNYDFLVRTNLSTFWDLSKLEKRLDTLPRKKCLTGSFISRKQVEEICSTPNHSFHIPYFYVAGYDMIISRDLIQGIIPHSQAIIDTRVILDMEDVSICTAIEKYCKVLPLPPALTSFAVDMFMNNNFSLNAFYDKLYWSQSKNMDHFRVKNKGNRNIDKIILKTLLKEIYHASF